MFDQDADEAFERAEDRAVKHQRIMLLAIRANVGRVEPLRHARVELERTALPGAADRIGQMELELGAVKGALAFEHRIVEPGFLERPFEVGLGAVPFRVAADALVGSGRELHLVIGKTEVAINQVEQRAERLGLADQLVVGAEDVPVVLGELAHAHDPVQRAVRFVAVAGAIFGEPDRQLACSW